MRTDPAIVGLLGCPTCEGDLTVVGDPEPDGHVMNGAFDCSRCHQRFRIVDGVPRFGPAQLPEKVAKTIEGFGYSWQRANAVMKDRRLNAPEVFLDFVYPVTGSSFAGNIVLDAGCGTGRFSVTALQFGARLVVGVDLSESVRVAFENTRHFPNALIVQADLLHLPLKRTFDYAFTIGVLHHTVDPRRAFLSVVSKVVPGGSLSAWVYGRENNGWIVHCINPIRKLTSRLPRPLLLAVSYALAIPLAILTKAVYGPVARRPRLARLRRWLFYFDYLSFLAQFDYAAVAVIVFDHAIPTIAEYIPRDEFAEWFEAAGLVDVSITMRGGNSWRGFGVAP